MGAWPYLGGFPVGAIVLQSKFGGTDVLRLSVLHWINQSMVAAVNYYNGSSGIEHADKKPISSYLNDSFVKSLPTSVKEKLGQVELSHSEFALGQAYLLACSSAVGIIVSVNLLVRRVPKLRALTRYAGFPAGSAANAANTYSIRGISFLFFCPLFYALFVSNHLSD